MAPINYFLQKKNFNRVKCFNIDQLDIEDNEEEFSLSKQQYKYKSMKQEYETFTYGDCKDRIDEQIEQYIFDIIIAGDDAGLSRLSSKSDENDEKQTNLSENLMRTFAKNIQIWLVGEEHMKNSELSGEYPATEWFGYYDSKGPKGPKVVICPERINNGIEILLKKQCVLRGFSKKEVEKLLYAIVTIHALAHAIMDPTNKLKIDVSSKYPQNFLDKSEYQYIGRDEKNDQYFLMEESLANKIVLDYFAEADKYAKTKVLGQVQEFMLIQPLAYKFGVLQHDLINFDWREWRKHKEYLPFFGKVQ